MKKIFGKKFVTRHRIKSIISMMLIIAIVLTLIPAEVFAQSNQETQQENQPTGKRNAEYESNGCKIEYKSTSWWGSFAQVEISISNNSNSNLDLWQLQFPYDSEIQNIWNAEIVTCSDGDYSIKPMSYNAQIKAGQSVSFGFIAKNGNSTPYAPDMINLHGDFYDNYDNAENSATFGNRYRVSGNITSSWDKNITGEITIENISDETLEDWKFQFPWDAEITNMWNGKYTYEDSHFVITPMEYNRVIKSDGNRKFHQTVSGFSESVTE